VAGPGSLLGQAHSKFNCRRTNLRLQATWETHSQQSKHDLTPQSRPQFTWPERTQQLSRASYSPAEQ
jgi:hypothetical protein